MGDDLAHLDRLARPHATTGLRYLHLDFLLAKADSASKVQRLLPGFVHLESLDIVARPLDNYPSFMMGRSEPSSKRLSVTGLRLNIEPGAHAAGPTFVANFTRDLFDAIDAASVRVCVLDEWTGQGADLRHLLDFPALAQLTINFADAVKEMHKCLPLLCQVLSQLTSVVDLQIKPAESAGPYDLSPLPLAVFLSSLPATIRSAELVGLCFMNFDGLAAAGLDHLDSLAPRICGVLFTGFTGHSFEEFVCVKIPSTDGSLGWHVCAVRLGPAPPAAVRAD